jgi:hypothetical protein
VDPVRIDDEAQRALEQHALRNVRTLAERLENADVLDRRKEKALVVAMGIGTVIALAAIAVSVTHLRPKPDDEERKRCELEVRVAAVWSLKKELLAKHPYMGEYELEQRVSAHFRDMKPVARIECAGGYSQK